MSRSWARSIVINVTGQTAGENLIETLKKNYFLLFGDENIDKSIKKLLAITTVVSSTNESEDNFRTLIPMQTV